jgi:acetyl-CoA carboxylase beta subunit
MNIIRVGQNRIYTPHMHVYLAIPLPKLPCIHRIYMVLANPKHYTCITSRFRDRIMTGQRVKCSHLCHTLMYHHRLSVLQCVFACPACTHHSPLHTHTHTHTHTQTHTHSPQHTHTHTDTHTHTHTHKHTHTLTPAHTHTHIHTDKYTYKTYTHLQVA